MADHLLAMHHAAQEWRLCGATGVPSIERDEWVTHYFEILVSGYAAQPPPVAAGAIKRRGRQKQSAAKNLLDDPARDGQIRCSCFWTIFRLSGFEGRWSFPVHQLILREQC